MRRETRSACAANFGASVRGGTARAALPRRADRQSSFALSKHALQGGRDLAPRLQRTSSGFVTLGSPCWICVGAVAQGHKENQLRIPATTNESVLGQTACGDVTGAAGFLALRCGDMRIGMIDCQAIRKRWEAVGSKLDERGRRVFAAGEVRAAGWGGLAAVSEITGLARSTIGRGLKDLDAARSKRRPPLRPKACTTMSGWDF